MRACVRARAFSKPMPTKSRRISGTTRGACGANGESGSVAHVQMSAKKVRTSSSHTCAVGRSSAPASSPRCRSRARAMAYGIYGAPMRGHDVRGSS